MAFTISKEDSEYLKEYMADLTAREQDMVQRKIKGDTNKSIAEENGISIERVRQIINRALRRARRRHSVNELLKTYRREIRHRVNEIRKA